MCDGKQIDEGRQGQAMCWMGPAVLPDHMAEAKRKGKTYGFPVRMPQKAALNVRQ